MIEIFKDIKDYEGLYQVSNFGNVWSLNYKRTGRAELMKTSKNTKGYLKVTLCKDGKRKHFLIHKLVAGAFLENPDNLPQVNHIDENKKNNRVDNLEWCDNKYNCNYGTRNQRIAKNSVKLKNGKTSKSVLQFSLSGEFIREWPSTNEVGRNGFKQPNIVKCCLGERKSAGGFIWRYKKEVV